MNFCGMGQLWARLGHTSRRLRPALFAVLALLGVAAAFPLTSGMAGTTTTGPSPDPRPRTTPKPKPVHRPPPPPAPPAPPAPKYVPPPPPAPVAPQRTVTKRLRHQPSRRARPKPRVAKKRKKTAPAAVVARRPPKPPPPPSLATAAPTIKSASTSGTTNSGAVVLLAAEVGLLLLGLALVFTPLPATRMLRLIDRRREVLLSAIGAIFLAVGVDLIIVFLS